MNSLPITTMDDDGNENGGKKLQPVNGFKAPIEWYETVKRVAAERRTTIGVAIQIVFNLGLPIYEQMKRDENESLKRQYKKLGISSLSQVPHHAEKKKGG